jgi:hypothetical protein
MELEFTVHGHSCDLALHPVSEKTARIIQEQGSEVYSMKALEWWRKGNTATWGMRIDDVCHIRVTLDGEPVELDRTAIVADPLKIRRRLYLDSRAKFLCVLGFDNEVCKFTWKWNNIEEFNPAKFDFMVHQWDRIMGERGYFILDEVRYDDEFATNHDWCDASGFTLVPPRIIDLEEVRRELNQGAPEHEGPPFPFRDKTSQTVSE